MVVLIRASPVIFLIAPDFVVPEAVAVVVFVWVGLDVLPSELVCTGVVGFARVEDLLGPWLDTLARLLLVKSINKNKLKLFVLVGDMVFFYSLIFHQRVLTHFFTLLCNRKSNVSCLW